MPQSRSRNFPDSRRQHLEQHGLRLNFNLVAGSLPAFNATYARFDTIQSKPKDEESNRDSHAQYQWRSRDNRKGRHTLIVQADHPQAPKKVRAALIGIKRMFTKFPYWDVSFWVAFLFTIGSAIFVVCGLFDWLPIAYPSTEFPQESTVGGGVSAFVGATLFQIGAICLALEAVNENQTGCFGWAIKETVFESDPSSCEHRHQRHKQLSLEQSQRKWEWWPSWKEIRTHYIHEIGFVANIMLATGATIFYLSGILVLPGIYDHLSQGVLWGVYWLSYLVGGVLFLVPSILYMLETQEKWYKPAPRVLGWHIGLWNLIGSVGWTLSASFGYCSVSWCEYQSDLSLLWASAAYLVGSLLLWYEALDKYPVEIQKKK